MFVGDRYFFLKKKDVYWFLIKTGSKEHPKKLDLRFLFRVCSTSGVFGSSLAHFGSLLVPFWSPFGSLWIPSLIHLEFPTVRLFLVN